MPELLAYFITFGCYGARLGADAAYTVDRRRNAPGTAVDLPMTALLAHRTQAMQAPPYELDARRRRIVLATIIQVCQHRGWFLLAAHVRTAHIHVVVGAPDVKPEPVMTAFKAYASRALNEADLDPPGAKRWSRYGSTRYLWTQADVCSTMKYVLEEQGDQMDVFLAETAGLIP